MRWNWGHSRKFTMSYGGNIELGLNFFFCIYLYFLVKLIILTRFNLESRSNYVRSEHLVLEQL